MKSANGPTTAVDIQSSNGVPSDDFGLWRLKRPPEPSAQVRAGTTSTPDCEQGGHGGVGGKPTEARRNRQGTGTRDQHARCGSRSGSCAAPGP